MRESEKGAKNLLTSCCASRVCTSRSIQVERARLLLKCLDQFSGGLKRFERITQGKKS